MVPQLDKSSGRLNGLVFKSASLAASVAIIISSGGALLAQTSTTTTRDDVIINSPGSSTGTTTGGNTTSRDTRFTCENNRGEYSVMYHPESQPNQAFAWATPSRMGGGWTPQLRCQEISRRLEAYRADGLIEMRTSVLNRQDIVCVTTERVPDCRIVFTVPRGQDARATRDRVFQNLTVADSGEQTQGVTTFTGNGTGQLGQLLNGLGLPGLGGSTNRPVRSPNGIYLKPFLDAADGGTGTGLKRGVPVRPNSGTQNTTPRLKPSIFR